MKSGREASVILTSPYSVSPAFSRIASNWTDQIAGQIYGRTPTAGIEIERREQRAIRGRILRRAENENEIERWNGEKE